jgi:hypothetical protein
MMRIWRLLAAGLTCVIALSAGAHTSEAEESRPAEKSAAKPFTYNPPVRNAPAGRVGGSTRGTAQDDLVVEVLAPNDVGLSGVDQPVLYWFHSRPVTNPVEVTIDTVDFSAGGPLLETTLKKSWPAGISALPLRDMGVRLKPGVIYRWSVAVVIDPAQRSGDVMASGLIQHARPVVGQTRGDNEDAARLNAEKGYWYDALMALSRDVERRPDRRSRRADLLEQVGLAAPAAFDRAAGPRS